MPSYVILGAAGGIGSALCERLAASGAQLVLGGRDAQQLEPLALATGGHPFTLDATVPAQVEACTQAAVERYGRLDGIANCVGSLLLKPAHLTSDDEWAATIGLTLAAAASYGARGIRVNCVAPGLVRTPLTARVTGNDAALKASVAMHALGRIGEPGEVAAALAWLLDPAQGWVTGQVLGVDGGLGSVRARGMA